MLKRNEHEQFRDYLWDFCFESRSFSSIFSPLDPDPKHSNEVSKTKFLYCAKLIRTVERLLSLFFQWSQKCAKNFKSIIIKTKEKTIYCFLITMDINVLICRWQKFKEQDVKEINTRLTMWLNQFDLAKLLGWNIKDLKHQAAKI